MRLPYLALLCAGLAGVLPALSQAQTAASLISSGAFQDADRRHQGEGTARFIVTAEGDVLLLFTDFTVTPGPDLEVWLTEGVVPNTSADVLDGAWLSLGPLHAPEGDQIYTLPAGPLAKVYTAVVIWCEDFSVLFAVAPMG